MTTHPSSGEDDSDPDSHENPGAESEDNGHDVVSRTEEQAREDIARGDLCFDHTLSPDAVDGRPENIRRVVPLVRMLQRIRDHDDSVSEEEHQVVMQCAMNTVQSSVLKDYVCRKRGPAAHRGVQTLEDLLEREAKQQRTVDPAVLQKREELAVAREKLFLELSDRIQNNF